MNLVDRVLTIVITATITSAIWIVAGGSLIENATSISQREAPAPRRLRQVLEQATRWELSRMARQKQEG